MLGAQPRQLVQRSRIRHSRTRRSIGRRGRAQGAGVRDRLSCALRSALCASIQCRRVDRGGGDSVRTGAAPRRTAARPRAPSGRRSDRLRRPGRAASARAARRARASSPPTGPQAGSAATREQESRRGARRASATAQSSSSSAFPTAASATTSRRALREELLDVPARPDPRSQPDRDPSRSPRARRASSASSCSATRRSSPTSPWRASRSTRSASRCGRTRSSTSATSPRRSTPRSRSIASQLALRDYVAYARGLNAYRAMTLPPETKFAEAYYVVDLPSLRTTPFSELRRLVGAPQEIEVTSEPLPISVVIRTKDRPALLREAIASVRATGYPCEIVVVNDGGAKPDASTASRSCITRLRAAARKPANAGVRAATNAFIAFLDDDDLFYPEHLATLANAARLVARGVVHGRGLRVPPSRGERRVRDALAHAPLRAGLRSRAAAGRQLHPAADAPLPRASTFLDLGGFDPAFDLFEDWDFLIRLSQRGDFLRIPRVTCEVRHFEGGTSVVLAAPEGSERVPRGEAAGVGEARRAADARRLRRRVRAAEAPRGDDATRSGRIRGEADDARRDIARLEREKTEVHRAERRGAGHDQRLRAARARARRRRSQALAAIADGLRERRSCSSSASRARTNELRATNAATHEELAARARRDRAPQRPAGHDLSLAHLEAAHDGREDARTRMSRVHARLPRAPRPRPARRRRHPLPRDRARAARRRPRRDGALARRRHVEGCRATHRSRVAAATASQPATSRSCRVTSRTRSSSTRSRSRR